MNILQILDEQKIRIELYLASKFKRFKFRSVPVSYKQYIIKSYALKFNYRHFIETGTCKGETTLKLSPLFERVYTVELDKDLYEDCLVKFQGRANIVIFNDESDKVLAGILNNNQAIDFLIYLDAHECADNTGRDVIATPVKKEIDLIIKHMQKYKNKSTILIDDARLFIGTEGYPEINELQSLINNTLPDYTFINLHDIICIAPRNRS